VSSVDNDLYLNAAGQSALLQWAEDHRRAFPWRETRDPWQVLVSEVMLQQTQAARVVERFERFVERWPDPSCLASEPLAEVLRFWQGLGYPRRAKNLHLAAELIVSRFSGKVPSTIDDLLSLPGVGQYTARAVMVFAYEETVGVVDTNVGRLLARWSGSSMKPNQAQQVADALVAPSRSWEWNQGLFDLAATVCLKRGPRCASCPVQNWCVWSIDGCPEPDPAVGSAGVSATQARFAESDRDYRGRILRALEIPDQSETRPGRSTLAEEAGLSADLTRFDRLCLGLERDGLLTREGVSWRLGN
jgi:A/G-specific adenine glycosylase